MYFNEHNPPHFHAEYNEFKASISIENLGLIEGKLPSKAMSLVVEWAQEHHKTYWKTGIVLRNQEFITKSNHWYKGGKNNASSK
jgi:hypothetical protein